MRNGLILHQGARSQVTVNTLMQVKQYIKFADAAVKELKGKVIFN